MAKSVGHMSNFNEDAERERCGKLFREALIWLLPLALTFVFLTPIMGWLMDIQSWSFWFVVLCGILVLYGSVYWGARAIWFGASALVLTVPPAWRNAVQVVLVLTIWSAPLLYFARTSSTLASILDRTGGWTLAAAAVVGLLAYALAMGTNGAVHVPARRFLVAIAVLTALCFMTKEEISVGDPEYFDESEEVSRTSPDERAYLHYVLYSAFAFGGVIVATRRLRLTPA